MIAVQTPHLRTADEANTYPVCSQCERRMRTPLLLHPLATYYRSLAPNIWRTASGTLFVLRGNQIVALYCKGCSDGIEATLKPAPSEGEA